MSAWRLLVPNKTVPAPSTTSSLGVRSRYVWLQRHAAVNGRWPGRTLAPTEPAVVEGDERQHDRCASCSPRYRLSPARRKRLGGAPTDRRTIAAKALALA